MVKVDIKHMMIQATIANNHHHPYQISGVMDTF